MDYAETIAVVDEGLYTFLGVDQYDSVHYFQPRDNEIHIPLFDEDMEQDLDLHFNQEPLATLHSYVQDSTWQMLKEPDYREIADMHGYKHPDLDVEPVVETEDDQSEVGDW